MENSMKAVIIERIPDSIRNIYSPQKRKQKHKTSMLLRISNLVRVNTYCQSYVQLMWPCTQVPLTLISVESKWIDKTSFAFLRMFQLNNRRQRSFVCKQHISWENAYAYINVYELIRLHIFQRLDWRWNWFVFTICTIVHTYSMRDTVGIDDNGLLDRDSVCKIYTTNGSDIFSKWELKWYCQRTQKIEP